MDDKGNLKGKSDIMFKRTIKPSETISHCQTSSEALIVSLNEKGKPDLAFISQLTGFDKEKILSDLKGTLYRIPHTDEYQTADEYLSGNVREKLFIAENAVTGDESYRDNVNALKEVQPRDLTAGEVKVILGATWISPEYINDFIYEIFQPSYYSSIRVSYSEATGRWYISNKSTSHSVLVDNVYGTEDINAYHLLEQALNFKKVKIYDTQTDSEGNKIRVYNHKKTTLAEQKQESIKSKFEEWIFKDATRRTALLRKYNDTFNCIRNRTYDGSHLTLPNANPEITLRPHQLNAIARIMYGGNSLIAHPVGAGKGFVMIASVMEAKRIGLCNKPVIVVPSHIVGQMANDFFKLYPSANILVASKEDFTPTKRKIFCSRIATGDYDAVIMGQTQFEKIPLSVERRMQYIQEEIDNTVDALQEVKEQRGERFTIKQLEIKIKSLKKQFEDLENSEKKDDTLSFEDTGIDMMMIDEAHAYKNLGVFTKMSGVAGIGTSSSQRAFDMFLKIRYTGNVHFFTATPVSNTLTEMYVLQKYLQYDTLEKAGILNFDSWASTFGQAVTDLELSPEGNKFRERTRFCKFHNLPSLITMLREVMDSVSKEELNLPVPKAVYENVVADPSDEQLEMNKELVQRAEEVRKGTVDPSEDNMLLITTDGRKYSIDARIINPALPDFENSIANKSVKNIFNI